MATGNDWLGKFKSRAKAVQETAKNRIEKLSETLDKKIKEAQEDLERQRAAETSGPAAPKVQRWTRSTDNPDGKIIAEVKPPPPIQQPVVQSPPVQPPPETAQAPTPVDEPIIIPRKKRPGKKPEHKTNSLEESGNHEEFVQKHSNKSNEQIPTVDESVENTAVIATPQKEELILIQESTSHSENKINVEKQEARPSKTELNQVTIQTTTSTVTSMPSATIDNPPIDHSISKDTPIEIPRDEQPASTITDDLPTENSGPEDSPIEILRDEQPASTITDNLPTENSGPKDSPIEIPRDEQPASTIIDDLPTENSGPEDSPIEMPRDEQPASTIIDDLPTENSGSEDSPIEIPRDKQPASTIIDDLPTENSGPEDSPIEIPRDEQPILMSIDNLPIERSDPEDVPVNKSSDKQLAVTNTYDSLTVDSRSENIPIDELTDEIPSSTNIEDLSAEHSDPKNIENKIPDDEPTILANSDQPPIEHPSPENIITNIPEDKSSTTTSIDDAPKEHIDSENIHQAAEHSDPENTQMEILDDKLSTLPDSVDMPTVDSNSENISQNIPNDELLASMESDNLPTEHSTSENVKIEMSDDESTTSSDIDDSPLVHSDSENVHQNTTNEELLATIESDESLVEQFDSKNMQTEKMDDELPVLADIADLPTVDSNQENILQVIPTDESVASTDSDDSSTKYPRPDDKSPTATNIDESPNPYLDPENMSINISDDELPATTEIIDSLNVKSDLENILMSIPDDELPALKVIDNLANAEPDSVNILMSIPDNELPTIEDIPESPIINAVPANTPTISNDGNLPDTSPDLSSILMNIPDDELPTIEDIADLPIVSSSAANILMHVPDDELPTIKDIDSKPKSSPMETKANKSSTTSPDIPINKPNDIPIEHPKLQEKLPTATKAVETPIKHAASNKDHSKISPNKIKTPPNELEDSFEDLKTTNIPVHPAPEKPSKESTNLTSLRTLISKIEDDDDDDDDANDFIASKKDTSILLKNISTTPEQLNPPNILKTSLSLSLTSLSDETPEDPFNDTPTPVKTLDDEPPIEETYEIVPTMSVETKRLSIVNSHSIPPGTKIQHINCSSTYIYLCTIDRKIFYAKLNPNDFDLTLNWQQHSDLAEQLVVSDSNRIVWRLHNKALYTANDPIKFPPIGSKWDKVKLDDNQPLLGMSINDQCGWFIKDDGTLWLLRIDDPTCQPINVECPFNLNKVFCFSEKVGVKTSDGEILIRAGCTQDTPEGGGWIFIEHNFGPIDDFVLLTNSDIIAIVDKKHHLWIHQYSSDKGFYRVLCDDDFFMSNQRYLVSVNSELLCLTDCTKQIHLFSDCLTGVQWTVIEKHTRLQRLIGAFSNEDYVWALTTDRRISSSNGKVFEKPRQAQFLTHATFVPHNSSQNTIIWSLDESCGIYVRPNVENDTEWEPANQIQFEWNRRLINIVCNNAGVWAVDDKGFVHFRHGHISANQNVSSYGGSILPPAWITVPGKAERNRSFAQVYCGPADWMVYATDNKQNVYTREGINEENRIGTSWKAIEDCAALELAISEHTLWLLTSCGEIQCRENISLTNPIGTRSTTLSGLFLSLTVSMDDSQVWALDSQRNLLKLDRLTVLFEK